MSDWLPPQEGIVPRIRIGRRWISILWALPIGAAALVLLIALAQSLRELPSVQAFIKEYPGIAQAAPSVDSGFPWWLQLQHFLNMLFMMFIIRAGIQILADHPRLYWTRDCTPGTEWFRFQHPVPEGRIWTSKDDSVTVPGWLGIPGVRHSIGLARWWHFSIVMLWTTQRHRVLRADFRHRSVASFGPRDLGRVPGRALDRPPVCVAELSGRRELDPLQRPAAAQLFHHGVRRRAGFDC